MLCYSLFFREGEFIYIFSILIIKPFIKKLFVFYFLYLILSSFISVLTPYHQGNPWYSTKIQFLEKNNQIVHNTFFFGSSRIYRQIDPHLFDSTLNLSLQESVSSYNVGAPATFNPQTYYLYENFLKSKLSNGVKYCFIELMNVDLGSRKLMHQEKGTQEGKVSQRINLNNMATGTYFVKIKFRHTIRTGTFVKN